MTVLARIADLVLNQPLLLMPDKAEVILGVLAGRIGIDGPELSRFEGSPIVIDEQGRVKERPYRVTEGGVAVITITGSLVNRGAWVGANSGLTSYEGIQYQIKVAGAAPEVRSVILDIHSPGGEAIGCFETAAMVRDLAAKKPVVALVNGVACSGAYAIASGATEIVTIGSGASGSIGVVTIHVDASKRLDSEGLKPTLIIAGAHKADGNPFGPLPEEVRTDFQTRINSIYDAFLACVAEGRGDRLSIAAARATEARVLVGEEAVKAGLADRTGTFESVLADLTRAAGRKSSMKGKTMNTEQNGGPAAETSAGITKADLDAAVAIATANANANVETRIKADRERMAGIDELAAMVGGNVAALKIIADAKAAGTSPADTSLALVKAGAFTKAAVLGAIQADDAGASAAAPAAPGGAVQVPQTEDGWKAEYQGSADLRAEFVSEGSYVAFKKAEAGGKVRILHGKGSK